MPVKLRAGGVVSVDAAINEDSGPLAGLWPACANELHPGPPIRGDVGCVWWGGGRYKCLWILLLTNQRFEKVDNLLPYCLWIVCEGNIGDLWVGAEIIGLI